MYKDHMRQLSTQAVYNKFSACHPIDWCLEASPLFPTVPDVRQATVGYTKRKLVVCANASSYCVLLVLKMLQCAVCNVNFGKIASLQKHLREHAILGEWNPPYLCGQANCQCSFPEIELWRKHVTRFHSNLEDDTRPQVLTGSTVPNAVSADLITGNDSAGPSTSAKVDKDANHAMLSTSILLDSLKKDISNKIVKLRANSSVTAKVSEFVASTIDDITEQILSYAVAAAQEVIQQNTNFDLSDFKKKLEAAENPAKFLDSDKKQRDFFSSSNTFVKPVQLTFGRHRTELKRAKIGNHPIYKIVHDT